MRFLVLVFLVISLNSSATFSQEYKGFLYGTVTLKNNKSYTGQLRWGSDAGAWDDLFEASKNELQIQEQIDIQGYEESEDEAEEVFEFSFMKLWEDKESNFGFRFKSQFGHIDKIIEIKNSKSATAVLKNGEKIKLRKRGSDIGNDITLIHHSLGNLEFDWENIEEIDFKDPPSNVRNSYGAKIYGNVLTIDGLQEGYIVWDFEEEAFEKDIIDGYHQNVKYEIEFGKIASLRPERNGAIITFKNGSELYLRKSSDVDKENDGIFIKTQDSGMINLSWSNLIRIDFTKPGFKSLEYKDFRAPRPIYGRVETIGGQSFKGKIVYDLDETWDIEVLDGRLKGTKYYIPFYLVRSITPQNYNYSLIELTNGSSLILGDEGDVNHDNHGILVWLNESKTRYIPWDKIKSVTFNPK